MYWHKKNCDKLWLLWHFYSNFANLKPHLHKRRWKSVPASRLSVTLSIKCHCGGILCISQQAETRRGLVRIINGNDIRQYGRVASHVSACRLTQRNWQLMNCLRQYVESIKQLAPVTREHPSVPPPPSNRNRPPHNRWHRWGEGKQKEGFLCSKWEPFQKAIHATNWGKLDLTASL